MMKRLQLPGRVKPRILLLVAYVFPHPGHRGDFVNVVISNGVSSVLRSRLRLKSKCLSDNHNRAT
jgi:hypothetical protein